MKFFISILFLFIGLTSKAQIFSIIEDNDTAKVWNPHTGQKIPIVTSSPNTFSIGTVNSTAPLTIANTNATPSAPQAGTLQQLISSGVGGRISNDTYASGTNGSIFQGRRAGGTPDAPTAAQSGMVLAGINGDGYGTSSFTGSGLGSMTIRADENFTNTSKATNLQFTTTPTGSTTQLERMRIKSTGSLQLFTYGAGFGKFDASGNLTSSALNSGEVTTALGFTPYNSTNPDNYISNATGLITQGTNVTITGSGTSGSPYVINASGGGGGAAWGGITGTLSSQTDLQAALDAKSNKASFLRLPSAYVLTSSLTAQKLFNNPTNGQFNAAASTTYEFEISFDLTGLSATSGLFSFGFGGTATYTKIRYTHVSAKKAAVGTAGASSTGSASAATALALVAANTSTTANVTIRGMIVTNASGTIQPQITLGIAAAATVSAGSYFIIKKIGGTETASSDMN